jgi:hypothetical protein
VTKIATVWWFSPVFSTNKTDCHNITEMLLKVALNTITLTLYTRTCDKELKNQRTETIL